MLLQGITLASTVRSSCRKLNITVLGMESPKCKNGQFMFSATTRGVTRLHSVNVRLERKLPYSMSVSGSRELPKSLL